MHHRRSEPSIQPLAISPQWDITHQQGTRPAQLPTQPVGKCSCRARFVRINDGHHPTESQNRRHKTTHLICRLSWGDMPMLFRTEDAEDIIIFVDGLAVIPPLLLIPPVAVRVSKLPILSRRVDVAAVLGSGEIGGSVSDGKVWLGMILRGRKGR